MERICCTTEFEVEGWRKIPPLIELLEKYTDKLPNMKLEMTEKEIVHSPNLHEFYWNFLILQPTYCDANVLVKYPMTKSFICEHFRQENPKKLTVYVSQVIPINQKYMENDYTVVRLYHI